MTNSDRSLEVIRDPVRMRERAAALRQEGQRLGVVPTMGYLHEGHLALLRAGRARVDVLIVTIFVNPTQFGPNEDLATYPRDEAGDLAKARSCGADIAFCPETTAMYGDNYQTYIDVEALSQPLCGASRAGHFRGVATVVTKLFHLTCPQVAVFGQKDFQQLALIRQMNRDLDFGIDIVGVPIVRESDGLAMSSRNAYLSPAERDQAVTLSQGLKAAQAAFADGERASEALVRVAREPIEAAPLARIDYVELRDATTLNAIDRVDRAAVLAMAVFVGKTRLIDNTVLSTGAPLSASG